MFWFSDLALRPDKQNWKECCFPTLPARYLVSANAKFLSVY